jgi:hypothetical protein
MNELKFISKILQAVVLERERPFLKLDGNCNVDQGDDWLAKKCAGNGGGGGGGGIDDVGGGGGEDVDEIDGGYEFWKNCSVAIIGLVYVLLFDCITKLFPWDGERWYWG